MWAHLQRLGVPVALQRGAADARARLARFARERTAWTTITDPAAARPADLVNRCFTADRPDALWVADFTHVPLAGQWVRLHRVRDTSAWMAWYYQDRPMHRLGRRQSAEADYHTQRPVRAS